MKKNAQKMGTSGEDHVEKQEASERRKKYTGC
jgi:hypothetical protein